MKINIFILIISFLIPFKSYALYATIDPNMKENPWTMATKDGPYMDIFLNEEENKTLFKLKMYNGNSSAYQKGYKYKAIIKINNDNCEMGLVHDKINRINIGECYIDMSIAKISENNKYTVDFIIVEKNGSEDIIKSFERDLLPANKEINDSINWDNIRIDAIHFPEGKTKNHGELYFYITLPNNNHHPFGKYYIEGEMDHHQLKEFEKKSQYNKIELKYDETRQQYGATLVFNIEDLYFDNLRGYIKIYQINSRYNKVNIYRNIDIKGIIHNVNGIEEIDMNTYDDNKPENDLTIMKKSYIKSQKIGVKNESYRTVNPSIKKIVNKFIQKLTKKYPKNLELITKLENIITALNRYTEGKPESKKIVNDINYLLMIKIEELK